MKVLILAVVLLNLIMIIGLVVAAKRLHRHIRKIIKAIWSLTDNFQGKIDKIEGKIAKLDREIKEFAKETEETEITLK